MDSIFSVANVLLCFTFGSVLAALLLLTMSIKVIPEHKRISVQRLGRHLGYRGPGIVLLIPLIDRGAVVNATDLLAHDQQFSGLQGKTGTAVGLIDSRGTVEIDGLEFPAASETLIPHGAMVRVKGIQLIVERVQ